MDKAAILDFDLLVEPSSSAGSRVRVLYSPAGEAAVEDCLLPGFNSELESTSTGHAPDLAGLQEFGARLFSAVFQGEVLALLRRSQDAASRQGGYLRLRLRLGGSSELANLPWELMYDPTEAGFLALRGSLSISRCLEVARPLQSQEDQPPLRLLAVIAGPSDLTPLETEAEWQGMQASLAGLVESGSIVLERLAPPTPLALQRRLRQGKFQIVHLVGHGSFDERGQDGVIYLENEKGYAEPVNSQRLADLLSVERGSLRLVALNACESAGFSTSGPFSGLAPALVRIGVPSVIAQRAAVPDRAASVLAAELYSALAAGMPVDLALGEGRRAMYNAGYTVEWALPVLYLRSGFDGRMFPEIQLDIPKLIEALQQSLPAGDPTPQHLVQALKDFKRFHACLHEWKELHNCLNDITYALGQFYREVERLEAVQETPDRRKLSRQWRPVAQKLDVLLESSASLQNISTVVYSESPQGISGPPWAVKLQVARQRLEELFEKAAIDPLELFDATADFSDQADLQMYLADKSLRETAGELYSLSQIVLGSLGNEPV